MENKELIFRDEVYAVVGAAMEVHSELGPGFLEAVYHAALKLELLQRGIPFDAEKLLPVFYKGQRLSCEYRADLLCYGQIVVELKALDRLSGKEESHWPTRRRAHQLRQPWQTRMEKISEVKISSTKSHEETRREIRFLLRVFFV